jgi:acetyltransferase-like isoleucine patch superfamily enzyme
MNLFSKIIGGLATLIYYKQKEFLFERSKKHVTSWGEYTYGTPTILNYDGQSKVTVARYCSFAGNVTFLLGANHKKGIVPNYPLSRVKPEATGADTNERGDIIIGNDVWIGYGATLIGPITIGNGAIIGAGAVVNRDVPAYAVSVGVPAQTIRYRFDESQIAALQSIAWWNWDIEKVRNASDSLFSKDVSAFIEANK